MPHFWKADRMEFDLKSCCTNTRKSSKKFKFVKLGISCTDCIVDGSCLKMLVRLKNQDVKRLKNMSSMWRQYKDVDIPILTEFKDLTRQMTLEFITKKNSMGTFGIFLTLCQGVQGSERHDNLAYESYASRKHKALSKMATTDCTPDAQ